MQKISAQPLQRLETTCFAGTHPIDTPVIFVGGTCLVPDTV